jgi:hypothetical protein
MKGAILFCDYLLLQRTWLLGLFSPRATYLFIGVRASLEVWFPSVLGGIRSLFFPGFHFLALSTLALSHRFSGLLFLIPLGFISPRNTLGISLQSFLL